jgi:hypothetical protein
MAEVLKDLWRMNEWKLFSDNSLRETGRTFKLNFLTSCRNSNTLILHILLLKWLCSPMRTFASILGFLTVDFLQGGVSPKPNPPTWRTRSPYLYPLETGWPIYTPRHWLPILVAFYDMHGLQWDYSFPRSPHGDNIAYFTLVILIFTEMHVTSHFNSWRMKLRYSQPCIFHYIITFGI